MHKLLERQIKKLFGSLEPIAGEMAALVEIVDETYRQSDDDRLLVERSLDLTSQELLAANAELRRDRRELERRVEERTGDLLRVNASLEREIAERRETAVALKSSEQRYQTLAENSPAGIIHADAAGRCLYVNRKFKQMSGLELEEASGDGWIRALHPEDRRDQARRWSRVISERRSIDSSELRLQRPDGEVLWVVSQSVALLERGGLPTGYVLTFTDITERKRAEEAIQLSEEKYRQLFEDSKDMIYISTSDGRLLDVNPAGVELFGFDSRDELLGVDLVEDRYLRPEDRDEMLREVTENGFVKDMEIAVRRKDGKVLTMLATTTPVGDESGQIMALHGILRDVTDRRRLEHRLHQAQKLEAVGRLAGGVAHDFNNLLTAILGFCELVRLETPAATTSAAHLDEIRSAARRGADLTHQLLAFSRRQVLEPKRLELNRIVSEMESLLRRIIGEDIELETRLAHDPGTIKADPSQVEQLLLNLAVNARDAMPEGGRLTIETAEIEIHIGEEPHLGLGPGTWLVLTVGDTGVGIEPGIKDQIFEPFFTTKSGGRGTGLGLSTVYGVVEQSGGHIEVESVPGEGSRFLIYLPSTQAPADPVPVDVVGDDLPPGEETILLVEDEPAVRSFLRRFLEGLGYRVLTAGDGREALEVAADAPNPIQLLLSDVVMPRLNGMELARELRRDLPDLKVLLMSGYTGVLPDRGEGPGLEELEGSAFLQKPFSTVELGRQLRLLLDAPEGAISGTAS